MKLKRSTDVVKQDSVVTFKERHVKSTFTKFLSCFKIGQEETNEDNGEHRVPLSWNLAADPVHTEKTQFLGKYLTTV